MTSLYLHIGIHKTGTTALQRTLASSRTKLLRSNIYYPNYDVIGRNRHYCHHDLAYSIGETPKATMGEQELKAYFVEIGKRTPPGGACVLSSEIFYRLAINNTEQRVAFIALVRKYLDYTGLSPTLVITLREQASFVDSLYREHVKQTRYSDSFDIFLQNYAPWLDYRRQLELWSKYFPQIRVLFYEELDRDSLAQDFLQKATGRQAPLSSSPVTNPSLNYDWTLVKRTLNSMAFKAERVKISGNIIQQLQNEAKPDESINHPRAHFISEDQARDLYEKHAEDNAYIAKARCDRPKQNPFQPLRVTPPAQKLVNPRFVRSAINALLAAEISAPDTTSTTTPAPSTSSAQAPSNGINPAESELSHFCAVHGLDLAVVSGRKRPEASDGRRLPRDEYTILGRFGSTGDARLKCLHLRDTKRFSNSLVQLINSITLARTLGVPKIVGHDFWYLPGRVRLKDGIEILNWGKETRLNPPLDETMLPALSGVFFRVPALEKLYPEFIQFAPLIQELRPHITIKATESPIPEDELVIHFRAGDIFKGTGANANYGQPPLAFYKALMKAARWKRVHMVYEDEGNPVIPAFRNYCQAENVEVISVSGTLESDLRYLLRAQSIVVGRGTFMPGVIALSENAKNIYCFNKLYWHWGSTANLYQIVDLNRDYTNKVLGGNWQNLPEQLDLMVNYPVENLSPTPTRWPGATKGARYNVAGGMRIPKTTPTVRV